MKRITHKCPCGAEAVFEQDDDTVYQKYGERVVWLVDIQAKEWLDRHADCQKEINADWYPGIESVSIEKMKVEIEAARQAERERIRLLAIGLKESKCYECTTQMDFLICKLETESE